MIIGLSGKMRSGKNTVASIIQYLIYKDKVKDSSLSLNSFLNSIFIGDSYSGFLQKSFAAKLKQIVSILTGIPVEDLEKQEVKDRVLGEEWIKKHSNWIKESEVKKYAHEEAITLAHYITRHKLEIYSGTYPPIYRSPVLDKSLTVRELLQKVGTDTMRNVIHPNVWVNALVNDYKITAKDETVISNSNNDDYRIGEFPKYPNWIISDLRFKNELQAIKDRGGITIRVERFTPIKNDLVYFKNDSDDSPINGIYRILEVKEDNCTLIDDKTGYSFGAWFEEISKINEHESEIALDDATFDYVIDNNGTIEELVIKVKEILIKEKIL